MTNLDITKLNLDQVFEIKGKVDYFYDQAEKRFNEVINPNDDVEYKKLLDTAVVWLHKLYDTIGGSHNITEFNKINNQK